ncbi:hypothetical protein [Treponema sp.]|uniref:hypothetical protein n=1 Tax=Treponema sp. TaxID=166 RepID=UPI003F0145DB
MKSLRFSFRCAAVRFAAFFLFCCFSLSFFSCSLDDDDDDYVVRSVGKAVALSEDDPVSGVYSTKNTQSYGTEVAFIFRPSMAYATACSCEGKNEPSEGCVTFTFWDSVKKESFSLYFIPDNTNPVYVVYNVYADADWSDGIQDEEIDKHSGVIIFKAKCSPYRTPTEGCYYGVKFQFLDSDGNLPVISKKSSSFSSEKIFIEGGFSEDASYDNISNLAEAVEKFAFNNEDYFTSRYWTSSYSGAEQTGRSVSLPYDMQQNVFTKTE